MRERVIGPYRGYYVTVSCLVFGEMGDRYCGWGKIFDALPQSTLQTGELTSHQCEHTCETVDEAMGAAEDRLFAVVDTLPVREPTTRSQELQCLMYVSRARDGLRAPEIQQLLHSARRRNAELGITGVLLYFDGNFMQYLEGPPPEVQLVFRIIRKDPQHTGLITFMEAPATERYFADWTMAFRAPGMPAGLEPAGPMPTVQAHRSRAVVGAVLASFLERHSPHDTLRAASPAVPAWAGPGDTDPSGTLDEPGRQGPDTAPRGLR